MAKKSSIKRLNIFPYFEGVNSLTSSNISKPYELSHAENARCLTIGTIEKRQGTRRLGDEIISTGNYGLFYFDSSNPSSSNFYRVSKVGGSVNIYYLNTSAAWTSLAGSGTALSMANVSTTIANGFCFVVNGSDNNRYIDRDGTTVITSATTSGHLYKSPIANKINFYKDRLYVADYEVSGTFYPTSAMMSSTPLGIVGLVDGDHLTGVTTIKVTDTKYVYSTDSLDVYRGGTKIQTLTVSAKTEDTITVTATTNDINSADELWVANTYNGERVFRWADNPASGINVKEYDTIKMSGGQEDRIKMFTNIGDYMIMANTMNMAVWNGSALTNYDFDIGCISDNGFVKVGGVLFFIHYTGIYATSGERPKLMSAKIEEYIKGATKAGLEAAAMGKKGLSLLCSIGDVTLYHPDGSTKKTISNVVLEYNLRTENWFVHTDISPTHFCTYLATDNVDRLEFASSTGNCNVYEFFYGSTDDEAVSNLEIPFRIDSNKITLSPLFEKICYPLDIIVEAERGSNIKTFVSLDDGPYYELKGDSIKGCTIIKMRNIDNNLTDPPRCRQINISLRDNSKSLCKISQVALNYAESLEEEESYPSKND
jgi:hypothetical protein